MRVKVGLCRGRHPNRYTNEYLFPRVVKDVMDFKGHELRVRDFLDSHGMGAGDELIIYVTGLTPCLIAALNVCSRRGVRVLLMHWDKEAGKYRKQLTMYNVPFSLCVHCEHKDENGAMSNVR